MFLKLGGQHTTTLLVTDINGNRIDDDVPTLSIRDVQENKYWNGISWQGDEFNFIMSYVENGVYSHNFTPEKTGVFSISAMSSQYSVSKLESLSVYDDDILKYDWLVDSPLAVKFVGSSSSLSVNLRIVKSKDNTYWDGFNWVDEITTLSMPLLEDTVYSYTFTPDEESDYVITIFSETSESFYIVKASLQGDNIAPVFINQDSLKSLDGSSSRVINEKGAYLSGVRITIFNASDKKVIGKTLTNELGEWNTMLKPGNYYFMFEKTGYISIGFERMVV